MSRLLLDQGSLSSVVLVCVLARFLIATERSTFSWRDKAKLLWRYGYLSPSRTQAAVASLLKTFSQLYDGAWLASVEGGAAPWQTVERLSRALGFEHLTKANARDYFVDEVKASERWVDEMVEGATRVNVTAPLLSRPCEDFE